MISVTQVLRRPRLVTAVFSCHGQTISSAAAAVKSTRDTGDYDPYYHYETQRPRDNFCLCIVYYRAFQTGSHKRVLGVDGNV